MSLYFGDAWVGQIEKPYWWDYTDEVLRAKIAEHSHMWDVDSLMAGKHKVDYDVIVTINNIITMLDETEASA
jgi:hypothetical protein